MLAAVLLFMLQLKAPDAASFVGQPEGSPSVGAELDRRTHEVGSLVRCPVCQGMSVADSPSEMAVNMKGQVRELLARGYTEEQILRYFELSYGQFVLLRPKFEGVTAAVWIIPVLALLGGIAITFFSLRKLGRKPDAAPDAVPASDPVVVAPVSDPYLSRVRELVGDKS